MGSYGEEELDVRAAFVFIFRLWTLYKGRSWSDQKICLSILPMDYDDDDNSDSYEINTVQKLRAGESTFSYNVSIVDLVVLKEERNLIKWLICCAIPYVV